MEDVMIKSHPLIKQLAIRLGRKTTAAKSLVIPNPSPLQGEGLTIPSPASGGGCPEGAGEGFVQRAEKVSLLRLLREDVSCVFQRDPAARSRFEVLTTYPGVHAILMQRVAQ